MKRISSYIMSLILCIGAAMTVASCSDDYAQPPLEIPGGWSTIGDGSWENPLQVWQVNIGTTVDGRESNWVCGYIVGSLNRDYPTYSELSADFGVPTTNYNTIILAQIPYDKEEWERQGYTWEDCVPVQLPSGTVRKALELDLNPGNFNRMVSIRGITGSKYLGAYAVRTAADFKWGDKGKYEPEIVPVGSEYFCNFSESLDLNYYIERGWTNLMQRGGLDGWSIYSSNGLSYATCSSYYGAEYSGPYINWLITPAFNLDEAKEKTFSFRSRAAYANAGSLEVYVLTSKNPSDGVPVKLDCVIATPGESGYGNWADSGIISLEEFSGTIYIGFRFESQRGGSSAQVEYNVTDVNYGGADPADWETVDPTSIGDYHLTTDLRSGSAYAMVYDSKLFLPLIESYTYGYLSVSDVAISDGAFTSSKENAFTFIAEGSHYVIKDGYDRYLYLDPAYSTFQVNLVKPASGYLWDMELQSDGSWKIINVDRDMIIEYAPNYGNVAPIAAGSYSGMGPKLYILSAE
ncbi:MAG: choice-of-anchor J domain-containing protein [Muribaculaceae bacterium]|nr:choice-of-anchor J domain-containing protein [Muribaculaceae bacterium]MDE7081297.1 choice-of-anchor J domain-containing protein [Muribaculaceae bacterium]